jgi:hypothetical protein
MAEVIRGHPGLSPVSVVRSQPLSASAVMQPSMLYSTLPGLSVQRREKYGKN